MMDELIDIHDLARSSVSDSAGEDVPGARTLHDVECCWDLGLGLWLESHVRVGVGDG